VKTIRKNKQISLLAGVALTAVLADPAIAAEAPVVLAAQTRGSAPATAPAPVPGADAGDQYAYAPEILVTARRREERAQDVPIALNVVGQAQLEGTGNSNLAQVQQLVPALQIFSFNPRNTNINIRGLGSNVAVAADGLDNGVGVYVDQVYYGRVGLTQFDLVDLDHVEVLRGPQGTLFGKNTTAGAINIASRAPSFDPALDAEATAGNYGYHQLRASVTGPIIADKLAARLSIADTGRNGFIDNVRTGQRVQDYDNFTLRGQLLFKPDDNLTVRLIGDYASQKQLCCVQLLVGSFDTYDNGAAIPNSATQRFARLGYTPLPFNPFARRTDANSPFSVRMKQWGGSAQIDWKLPGATVTSITAYRRWDWNPHNDVDFTGLSVFDDARTKNRQRQFSQEIRLASEGSRKLDYVVGAYYFWQVVKNNSLTQYGSDAPLWFVNPAAVPTSVSVPALSGFGTISDAAPRTYSSAAFGQLTWNATDQLSVTAGLRYTHEIKRGSFRQVQFGPSLAGLPVQAAAQGLRNNFGPASSFFARTKDDSISGTVNVAYKFTPDILAYATYSRGSKSGGINLTTLPAGVSPTVRPERVNSFELGLKSSFLDQKVQLNLAAYWTDVSRYQTLISEISSTAGIVQYIANIKGVRSRGIEGDLSFSPTKHITLSASGAYNDATYRSYQNGTCPPEKQYLGKICDLSGQQLAGAPKWSGSLTADAAQPIGSIELYGRADYSFRSSYFTAVNNSRYSRVDSYGITNLRVGVRSDDSRWDASVWSRNLFDVNHFQTLGASDTGLISAIAGDPRTFGVTLRTKL